MREPQAFLTSLESTLAALEPWRAQALAALAAARLFPILARPGGVASDDRAFVGEAEVALALELAWAAALGEAVADAELRYARQALSDLLDDLWHDLHGTEQEAFGALLDGLAASITPEPRRAARDAIAAALQAAEQLDERFLMEELAFWRAALGRVAALPERSQARVAMPAITGEHREWLCHAVAGYTGWGELGEADPGWISELVAADAARAEWIGELRRTQDLQPWREPTGIPAGYRVIKVGRGPSAQQGILSVSGHEHVALADAATGEILFAPPNAIALGMLPDERGLISWRVERRPGASGVARGDVDWILERYAWPERTLTSTHVVAARTLIEWHWPGELAVPFAGGGRLLVLGARSEDDFVRLYLVTCADGTVRETTRRDEAQGWLTARG